MAATATDARSDGSGSRSVRSSGSRRYKVVSRGSDVDESLFGVSKMRPGKSSEEIASAKKVPIGEVSIW